MQGSQKAITRIRWSVKNFSELQRFIAKVLFIYNGCATLDEIADLVHLDWDRISKPDGSRYGTNYKKVIQGSLGNISGKAYFRKDLSKFYHFNIIPI